MRENFAETEKVNLSHKLISYTDSKSHISWVFTVEGNPAHPAWITRQVFEREGGVYAQQVGYFAGSEEAFAGLFRLFQEGIAAARDQMQQGVR